MKTKLILIVSCLCLIAGLAILPITKAEVPESYIFGHKLGDIVEYEGILWQITSKSVMINCVDDNTYPYYRLTRPRGVKFEHIWVWACVIDNFDSECCGDPPPQCPIPPC